MGGDHKCPVCQATFTRPQHVARHMRSHTGDRPYKCQYCGDQFARSDLLSRHVNKCHANEKPLVSGTGSTRRKGSASLSRATTSKQACDQCVQSSLPCDGSNPCGKCVQRKSRCTYVKFHRQTAPVGPGHHPRPPEPINTLGGSHGSDGSSFIASASSSPVTTNLPSSASLLLGGASPSTSTLPLPLGSSSRYATSGLYQTTSASGVGDDYYLAPLSATGVGSGSLYGHGAGGGGAQQFGFSPAMYGSGEGIDLHGHHQQPRSVQPQQQQQQTQMYAPRPSTASSSASSASGGGWPSSSVRHVASAAPFVGRVESGGGGVHDAGGGSEGRAYHSGYPPQQHAPPTTVSSFRDIFAEDFTSPDVRRGSYDYALTASSGTMDAYGSDGDGASTSSEGHGGVGRRGRRRYANELGGPYAFSGERRAPSASSASLSGGSTRPSTRHGYDSVSQSPMMPTSVLGHGGVTVPTGAEGSPINTTNATLGGSSHLPNFNPNPNADPNVGADDRNRSAAVVGSAVGHHTHTPDNTIVEGARGGGGVAANPALSAFGLMSLDDANVLAGLGAGEGSPFFGGLDLGGMAMDVDGGGGKGESGTTATTTTMRAPRPTHIPPRHAGIGPLSDPDATPMPTAEDKFAKGAAGKLRLNLGLGQQTPRIQRPLSSLAVLPPSSLGYGSGLTPGSATLASLFGSGSGWTPGGLGGSHQLGPLLGYGDGMNADFGSTTGNVGGTASGPFIPNLSTGLTPTPGREMDSRELKEFWKLYMRTPLTGPGSSNQLFPATQGEGGDAGAGSSSNVGGGGLQGGGGLPLGTPFRRPRVASMPSSTSKTPLPLLYSGVPSNLSGRGASPGESGNKSGSDEGSGDAGGLGPLSSMRTTLHPANWGEGYRQPTAQSRGQGHGKEGSGQQHKEDLSSYEAAVLARKAPLQLNFARAMSRTRRKNNVSAPSGVGGGSQGSPSLRMQGGVGGGSRPSSSLANALDHGDSMGRFGGSDDGDSASPISRASSVSLDLDRYERETWFGNNVNGSGGGSVPNSAASEASMAGAQEAMVNVVRERPSIKRLASGVLESENVKRKFGEGGATVAMAG